MSAEQKGDMVTIVVALEDAKPAFVPASPFQSIQLGLDWSGLYQKKCKPALKEALPTLAELPARVDAKERVLDKKPPRQQELSYFFLPEPNVVLRPLENYPNEAKDAAPLVCTKCGQRLAAGNFCSHCGSPVVLNWPFCPSLA